MSDRFHNILFSEELPRETLPWQTVTEIVDNKRVIIENHRGIIVYSSEKIVIKLTDGSLCVIGNNLCVAYMSKQQLIINGTIQSINLTKGT